MKYLKIEIVATEEEQERLIALLDELGATGFEQVDNTLAAYFQKGTFLEDEVLANLQANLHNISEIEDQNWNEVWEANFQPVVLENYCAVRAFFHEPITTVKHEIIITPKMSFGTGHHATTYMMMEQMRDIPFKNKTVFDFGTGTGILAMLAKKLGAARVEAIDIDDWSIKNAQENFARNDCSDIMVTLSTSVPPTAFDIVLANINKNIILQYLPQLKVATEGMLLISGLLLEDENVILDACALYDLRLTRRMEREGWVSLLLVHASEPA